MRRNILFSVLLSLVLVTSAFAGYVDNDNGIVSDTTTNLLWQQQDDGATRTWENAISYCEGLTLGGFTDWRLPNIKELSSLVDDSRHHPSIDPLFTSTKSADYWSSTTFAGDTGIAFTVYFVDGGTWKGGKTYTVYVRCVRRQ